jgi:hypothetical protein
MGAKTHESMPLFAPNRFFLFLSPTDLLQCSLLLVKVAVPAGALEVYCGLLGLLYDFSPLIADIICYLYKML